MIINCIIRINRSYNIICILILILFLVFTATVLDISHNNIIIDIASVTLKKDKTVSPRIAQADNSYHYINISYICLYR